MKAVIWTPLEPAPKGKRRKIEVEGETPATAATDTVSAFEEIKGTPIKQEKVDEPTTDTSVTSPTTLESVPESVPESLSSPAKDKI